MWIPCFSLQNELHLFAHVFVLKLNVSIHVFLKAGADELEKTIILGHCHMSLLFSASNVLCRRTLQVLLVIFLQFTQLLFLLHHSPANRDALRGFWFIGKCLPHFVNFFLLVPNELLHFPLRLQVEFRMHISLEFDCIKECLVKNLCVERVLLLLEQLLNMLPRLQTKFHHQLLWYTPIIGENLIEAHLVETKLLLAPRVALWNGIQSRVGVRKLFVIILHIVLNVQLNDALLHIMLEMIGNITGMMQSKLMRL
mmetsp:Transcript_7621/g.28555  ORF Transcript_7621/g.28555 Transcript_7621/m.28555 type:complete len:254 (+) Transcript_7621:5836-6597(+)